MHEFPFSYSHTEWYLLFFRETTLSKWSESRLSKADYNNNSIMFCCCGRVIIFAVMFFYVCQESTIALYGLEMVMPVIISPFVFNFYNAYHFNV